MSFLDSHIYQDLPPLKSSQPVITDRVKSLSVTNEYVSVGNRCEQDPLLGAVGTQTMSTCCLPRVSLISLSFPVEQELYLMCISAQQQDCFFLNFFF